MKNPKTASKARPRNLKPVTVLLNPEWQTPSNGRHHVFLFDGTCNDETGADPRHFRWDKERCVWVRRTDPNEFYSPLITNVAKTWQALGPDGDNQITHYLRGVGNGEENDRGRSAVEGALAHEEESIRHDAYCRFLSSYRKGDCVSILGFSRGAASARLFARDIARLGVVASVGVKQRMAPVRNGAEARREIWEFFPSKTVKVPGDQVPIAFIGAWDTVATFMNAKPADWRVPDTVRRALHCVALDELRDTFTPTLMPKTAEGRIREVWFPGGHCDVGGSYRYDALARVTLDFMWQAWDAALTCERLGRLEWRDNVRQTATDLTGADFIRHQAKGVTSWPGMSPRDCKCEGPGRLEIHRSVVDFSQACGLFFGIEDEKHFPPPLKDPPGQQSIIYAPINLPESDQFDVVTDIAWT